MGTPAAFLPCCLRTATVADNCRCWCLARCATLQLSITQYEPADLACSFNRLQRLPAGVSALTALKLLDVSDNPLMELPEEVASMPSLASLNCSKCSLSALPDALGVQQPNLTAVNASDNQITAVPQGLSAAKALAMLNMSKNNLAQISGVADLQMLRELDVSHNQLQVG